MVSSNPLFRGKWNARKFQATVINDIWPEVLFFTLVATSMGYSTIIYLLLIPASGNFGIQKHLQRPRNLQSTLDGSWYGTWFGHLFPNILGV